MKISVITPSYNQVQFIERTIQSVLSQRGDFKLEYIVVDGLSTDGTEQILQKYCDRIRLISEPDDGQSDAINKGMALATGEVVCWLNSDDTFEPNCLQNILEVFDVFDHLSLVVAVTDRIPN